MSLSFSLSAFLAGFSIFVLDGVVMAKMARALLDSGSGSGRALAVFLCAIRLFVVGGALYIVLVPFALSALWLVIGALCGLAVFCTVLVANPRQNFSLFSAGKLR